MKAIHNEITKEIELVIRKAISMYLRRFDKDLFQDACLAFCIRKTKPNYTPETMAHLTAKTVVLSFLRKEKNRKRISTILSDLDDRGESIMDTVSASKDYDEYEMVEYRLDHPVEVEKANKLKIRRGRPVHYKGEPLRL